MNRILTLKISWQAAILINYTDRKESDEIRQSRNWTGICLFVLYLYIVLDIVTKTLWWTSPSEICRFLTFWLKDKLNSNWLWWYSNQLCSWHKLHHSAAIGLHSIPCRRTYAADLTSTYRLKWIWYQPHRVCEYGNKCACTCREMSIWYTT